MGLRGVGGRRESEEGRFRDAEASGNGRIRFNCRATWLVVDFHPLLPREPFIFYFLALPFMPFILPLSFFSL